MAVTARTYRIGVSHRDITPPVGIRMCGFAHRTEPSTDVYHPLQAAVLAIDDGDTGLLIVGADLLGFYDRTEDVRSAIAARTGLPEAHIVLAGSHTHCGPHIREFDVTRLGPLNTRYLSMLTDAIADACAEAWEARAPGHLQAGLGHCSLAVSRRRLREDGTVEWGPYPDGISDHQVPVIFARNAANAPKGVLYSYACHPTSRAGTLIGGDYVSFAHDRIREGIPGAVPCFVQGCGADQKPVPENPAATAFDQRTVPQVHSLGSTLGEVVIQTALGDHMRPVTGPIRIRRRVVMLRSIAPDAEDARRVLAGNDARLHGWARWILDAVEHGTDLNREAPFEIQTVTMGNSLAIITLAGEITVEHGLRLKRDLASDFDQVLVIGYANHIVGYVPVERQIPEAGYCVEWANKFHGRTGRWVSGTEEQIHAAIHDMLNQPEKKDGSG